ncbi:MAG TPA: RdgB/HAM1 family non-canonical purine NTP pyrophosphatase [Chthoniobacteraceae bacterium]|nr:RdgB/HAM1 family non-canonical purine NTP pyrophosphatase [Chthoniobacteraceae bacterium]
MNAPLPLLLATRNRHKTGELGAILGARFAVEDLLAHPSLPEVEETGATFLENATLKAVTISQALAADPARAATLVMADDSGLETDALDGAPGVRSARFAGEKATDADNLRLLLERLAGNRQRSARFRCVIAIAREGRLLASFDGRCEGTLAEAPRGDAGFGYDPIFIPEGEQLTFAQLPAERKNAISHRARALAQALEWLRHDV